MGTLWFGFAFSCKHDGTYKMRELSYAFVFIFCSSLVAQAQPAQWSRFSDSRLGVGVDVPIEIFTTDRSPSNKLAGRIFETADGRADLRVYAIPNKMGESPAAFMQNRLQLPKTAAVYKRVTNRILAVSGFRRDQIWYARCNFATARVNCVAMNYPAAKKRDWDAVVTRISNTLSFPGNG